MRSKAIGLPSPKLVSYKKKRKFVEFAGVTMRVQIDSAGAEEDASCTIVSCVCVDSVV